MRKKVDSACCGSVPAAQWLRWSRCSIQCTRRIYHPRSSFGAGRGFPAETNAAEAADSQATANAGDMTPEELAQWAWAQMEAHDEESYAVDYDIDMTVSVELDGESTTQKVSGRVKEIDSETDGDMTYESMQMNGAVTETWNGGGLCLSRRWPTASIRLPFL